MRPIIDRVADVVAVAVCLFVSVYLLAHVIVWAGRNFNPAPVAEPEGCGSDLECCQRFNDCDVDFMADVAEGRQE